MNVYTRNLERIEFVVTMGCTGRCKHCSEGSHIFGGEHIDGETAARAVAEVCRHYDIKSLMTFGGEPLLYPETVCRIHRAAMLAGIPKRELITNGFFSRDRLRIKDAAAKLAESGVNRVMLSVDAFHQETIPIEPVEYFVDCIRESGVPVSSTRTGVDAVVSKERPQMFSAVSEPAFSRASRTHLVRDST